MDGDPLCCLEQKFLKEAGVINTALGLILGAICIILIEKNYAVMINSQDEEGENFLTHIIIWERSMVL